jgi:tetratricopeptide (TPR) repeat protein
LPKLISLGDLLYAERYQDAIEAAHAVLAREPGHPGALFTLCAAFARIGSTSDAHETGKLLVHMNSTGALQPEVRACDFENAVGTGNVEGARNILDGWKDGFPDKFVHARDIANAYVQLHDFDNASDWYQRAYERRESRFFESVYWPPGARYRATARWKILTQQPQFREWQAEHDRIAAELAVRGGAHE